MIDTNTVNYAIDKMENVLTTAMPTIQNISSELVTYTVEKQIFNSAFIVGTFTIIFLISLIIFIFSVVMVIREDDDNWGFISMLSGCIGLPFGIMMLASIFDMAPDTILAIRHPEMFTVHQLIESNK